MPNCKRKCIHFWSAIQGKGTNMSSETFVSLKKKFKVIIIGKDANKMCP